MLKFETKNHQNAHYQTNKEGNMLEKFCATHVDMYANNRENLLILEEDATHVDTYANNRENLLISEEDATHVDTYANNRKNLLSSEEVATHEQDNSRGTWFSFVKAFTLAEVLITIGIIGVVAVLVLPSFIQDMSERINSNRQANIAQKITKSVELMAVNGDYTGITNTEEFVNKLSKYLKIAKVCDKDHLEECWPTKEITTAKGEKFQIKNAKTSKDLHVKGNTDNVGLILADGATLIMSFNPDAEPIPAEKSFTASTKALPVGENKTKDFAYTSNATGAIDFVMDVNGKTGPNAENDIEGHYYDIRSFRTATFTAQACAGGIVIDKICVVDLGLDYNAVDCTNEENIEYCKPVMSSPLFLDFWAGGNKACDDIGLKMPSYTEIFNVSSAMSSLKYHLGSDLQYYMHSTLNSGNSNYTKPIQYGGWTNGRGSKAYVLCISK